jgi:hypothetical protein
MSIDTVVTIVIGLMLGISVALILFRKIPKKLRPKYFVKEWRQLQSLCRDKNTWPDALLAADKLLDKALKKRRFKGKTMGERLVSAQRAFTDNDDIWFAHNLTKKIRDRKKTVQLKESDVKEALISFREALKDLGALPDADQRDS